MKYLFVGCDRTGQMIEVSEPLPEVLLPRKEQFNPEQSDERSCIWSGVSYKRIKLFDGNAKRHIIYMNGDVARPIKVLLDTIREQAEEIAKLKGQS